VGSSEDVHLAPEYKGSDSQLFKLIPEKNGYFAINNKKTGKVLDISGGSTAAGTKLIQYEANGGENQQFAFIPYVVFSYGKSLVMR